MPMIDALATADVRDWRRDIHRHPELGYEVHRTAGAVADRLRAFGCDEVATGIGRIGVVGLIRGRGAGGRTVGLRADMDALPITEANTDLAYASTVPGRMHACGHDGHTAMLLGAARHLSATRRFAGTVAAVFQPAEEGGAGGRAMVADGLMTRFAIDEIYGMHNLPGLPVGHFCLRPGPVMAAADRFEIRVEGLGGHAATPHLCRDPVLAGAGITGALQQIASRNVDPLDPCVVSVTQFHAGSAGNVIPQEAVLNGTVRTLKAETRALAEARLRAVVAGLAAAHGVEAAVTYSPGYPVTVNHPEQTRLAAAVAAAVAGERAVDAAMAPMMGAEDFSFMLQERPGAFIFTGNGDTAGLHHPAYDFDDAVLPVGMAYWVRLAETALPLAAA